MTDFYALQSNVYLDARACTDPHEAALHFDQARADMWRWRRRFAEDRSRWEMRQAQSLAARRAPFDLREWQQMGVTVRLYRNARDCARVWRRRLNELAKEG